jgi:murein DD-endopeptidase MepM/ murein hydrolase activator NlpD
MGNIHFDKKFSMKSWFNGKGFYMALAVCLVAVGAVAVTTFVDTLPGLSGENSSTTSKVTTTTNAQQAGQVVTNVPDDRTTTTTASKTAATTKASDVEAGAKVTELFILPLTNEVLTEFSDNKQVYSMTMGDWRTHNGTDFVGEKFQDVKALADGTILNVSTDSLWGNIIEIDHGFGIKSRYCGVTTDLKKGTTVKAGDLIGKLGDIPCEILEPAHLHLEMTTNGAYVNPVEAIGRDVKKATTTATTTATGSN